MSIKISLRDLTDAQASLMKVLGNDMQDFKLAYRLGRIADKVLGELKHFDKLRTDKIKELGEADKPTGNYRVKPENIGVYREGLEKVLDEEVELNISLIPLCLLEKEMGNPKSTLKLSAVDFSFLDKFIDHEAKEEPKKEETKH